MQVRDLAVDLKVETETLLRFLRGCGVRVGHADARLADADVARVRTRLERERRAGRGSAAEIIQAAAKVKKPTRRRRRRRPPAASQPAEPKTEAEDQPAATQEAQDGQAAAPVSDDEARATTPADSEARADDSAAEAVKPETETSPQESAPDEQELPRPEPGTGTDAETATAAPARAEKQAEPDSPADSGPDDTGVLAAPASATSPETQSSARPSAVPRPVSEGAPVRPVRPGAGSVPGSRRTRRPSERGPKPQDGEPGRDGLRPAASAGPGGRVRIQAEGYTTDGRKKQRRKKGKRRPTADRHAAQENVQRVMAELKGGRKKSRRSKSHAAGDKDVRVAEEQLAAEARAVEAKTIKVNEFLTAAEIAELIGVSPTEIIGSAFKNMGLMVTINQRLDFDQIELLLEGFGYTAVRETDFLPVADSDEEDDPADLVPRPPVVTVMGHVDHGKTRLLDWIRNTNVVAGEAGGITQHIGAYHVELDDSRTISFLDTPGHAAFTAMRARGADLTDVVVLVVAADDAVMPQTIEAISHATNAGVPMVVAVNKIDLPAADPARVKQTLLQHGVTVEDFGGDTLVAEVSAKTGQGMDDLLEKVLLQAELLELKANPSRSAVGTVVEAELDVGKGPLATVLVQKGTLKVGENFVAGLHDGRIRALLDERGNQVKSAGPGIPVQILGCAGVPRAGDLLQVMDSVQASDVSQQRRRLDREKQLRIRERGIKLGDFSELLAAGQTGVLRLVIKGDVDGSVQALSDSLEQLATDEVKVEIVHRGVGAINESDVMLAVASGAVVIGFRVRPDTGSRHSADREKVDLRTYDIIYEAVDDVRSALEGMLAPERRESVTGTAEARVIFKIKGIGTIAGSYVTDGVLTRNDRARIVRNGVVVYEGEIGSLKRFKDDAREVKEGFECGVGIANFNDVKVGDVIETYHVEEVARTLAAAGAGQP